jgi:hypothetical protein
VEGGWEPETSRAGIDDLMKKTTALGAAVFVISSDGPAFDDYKRLCTANKCRYIGIPEGKTFENLVKDGAFGELMTKLGKSVSQGSRGIAGAQQSVRKDVYGLAGKLTITEL